MAFGRIGCFHAGCCHGRPCGVGMRYSQAHADEGFPWYYVEVKIFPVPLVESLIGFSTVAVGVWFLLNGYPVGTVLVWYTVFYGVGRFALEFFRGDPERPYWHGLSEAQWTSLSLTTVAVIFSLIGKLPLFSWQLWGWALIVIGSLVVLLFHKSWEHYRLLNPHHLQNLFQHMQELEQLEIIGLSQRGVIPIRTTEIGLSCSCGTIHKNDSAFRHFTFSSQNQTLNLDPKSAQRLEFYLRTVNRYKEKGEIIAKQNGIFHITFRKPLND